MLFVWVESNVFTKVIQFVENKWNYMFVDSMEWIKKNDKHSFYGEKYNKFTNCSSTLLIFHKLNDVCHNIFWIFYLMYVCRLGKKLNLIWVVNETVMFISVVFLGIKVSEMFIFLKQLLCNYGEYRYRKGTET
jgi:hypothetical protein